MAQALNGEVVLVIRPNKVTAAWTFALTAALLWAGVAGSVPATADTKAAAPAAVPAATQPVARPADPIAHDPTMAKQGAWYYVVITGDAGKPNTFLPMKRSKDLKHWSELGPVFSSLPSWVLPTLGIAPADAPKDLWAPDLNYVHGEWRLYYAVSKFGTNNSAIALATTKSLDPRSKAYGWVDHGVVVRSMPDPNNQAQYNAIDPDLSIDAGGREWLSFGSFWTGIKMRRIDAATGMLSAKDTKLYNLATRPAPPDAIEGPSIVRHGAYYYLFVAFDYCCRGVNSDYRVMMGRSRTITGPYVDRAGVPMLQGGGTEVLRGYNEFVGTGGADVYSHGGTDYFVNHYYDATDQGVPKLNVRTLSWRHGWPKVSDPVNPSRTIGHGDAYVKILPRGGNTVVEDNGCGYEGSNIGLWTDLGNPCQQWQISDRGLGSRILNHYSNKVAEVAACHNVDGGNVAQWGWLGFLPNNDCQRWTFTAAGDGYTTISTVLTGHRVWNAAGGTTTAGTNIEVTTATAGNAAQQFRFSPVGKVLLAGPNAMSTLGVVGCRASTGHGHQVRLQQRSTRDCQTWRFRHVGSAMAATYTVTNTATGRQLAVRNHGSQLRVVTANQRNLERRTWTLTPTNSGTWNLTSGTTTRTVKLLLP